MDEAREIKLKVMESVQDDVNKGVVKVDTSFMRQLGVNPGDVVEIKGERITAAVVDRAYPGDIGLNIIRMDGNTRRNAKTSIGEIVYVKKAEVKPAKKVVIAPANKGIMVNAPPIFFKQGLLGKALVKGDLVALRKARRTFRVMNGPGRVDDLFSMLENQFPGFGFGDLKFFVVDTLPKKEIVVITEETEIELNPNAEEIKEEESATSLGINYEDIGGLKEEIRKVQEMVELPLRHPEIFDKLGIEAPKGLLLHGPPGTGKTLLAKAVASETNAHFILINGPEIMSKFYGQSLPYDEKVLVKKEGIIQRLKIGEIVENNMKNIEVACFDKKNKVTFKKIDGLIKHALNTKVYRVKTKSGRNIRVTADHCLFTLGQKGIEDVKTSYLIPGKSFIVIPQKTPFNPKPIYSLDLIELLSKEDHGISAKNVMEYLDLAQKKLGLKECARILEVKERYYYDLKSKNVGIPVSKFVKLMSCAGIKIQKNVLQIGTKRSQLPAILSITEDLVHFFGWWIAEGSYSKGSVRVSLHRNELPYICALVQRLFGNCEIYHKKNTLGSDVFINSRTLWIVMEKILGFKPGSKNKEVPTLIYNLDEERIAAFLRGYFSGDGSVNRHGKAPQIEVTSASAELIDDIVYLLSFFGIVAKVYDRHRENSRRLTFASFDNLNKFRKIGFVDSERNEFIYDYINSSIFSRESQIPIVGKVAEIVHSDHNLSAWTNSKSIGTIVIQQHHPELYQSLALGDLTFDLVQEIYEEKEQPQFVYDLSVPDAHNFLSGTGGIFAHNSEENLRKKFEEAEQNAPSIIFFDEIDAIATKREETKGDVEKRVVAQLLGLMDGLKSRGKVIVIAATNMPNLLDPAFRRPGRFDREIEIGVPSKEGRLEILKIHTRNMPIEGSLYGDIVAKYILPVTEQKKQSLEQEIKDKEQEIESCNDKINKTKVEITNNSEEIISFKSKIENKKKEVLDKKQQLKTFIDNSNHVIETQISKLEEIVNRQKEEIRQIEEQIRKVRNEIEELENSKNNGDQSFFSKIVELIKGKNSEIQKLEAEINLKKEKILSLRKEHEIELEQEKKRIAYDKKSIDYQISTRESEIINTQEGLESIENQIKLKEKQIEEHKQRVTILDELILKNQQEIPKLQKLSKEISENKPKLVLLAEEIISEISKMDRANESLSLNDPRRLVNENKNSELYQQLGAINLLDIIVQKAKQDKESINSDLEQVAKVTHGFVGADMNALAKEAAMIVLRKILPDLKGEKDDQPISKEILEKIIIKLDDFKDALKVVRPSAMREVFVEKSDVSWTDVGGLEEVKNKLKEAVEWPLKNPELFKRMGIRPPRGILLYGPPGTGKTMLAKAVAKESEANFILINGPSLLSKWVGESEKAVREIFRKARQTAPTILFFDEIDALVPRRGMGDGEGSKVNDKIVNQMLTEIDGLEALNDVLVIAATNRPDIIDPGLLRQGRFDRIIYTPVPSIESRKKIFEVHLGKMAIDMEEKKETKIKVNKGKKKKEETLLEEMPKGRQEEVSKLAQEMAEKTEGYVGSDIEGVCREAAMIALRESFTVKGIRREHLEKALDVVKASVDKEVETAYKQMENYFSAARAKQIKEKPGRDNYFG